MFHIGIATQHPPLPDPSQLSTEGIDFIRCCLTLDPSARPTADQLLQHKWISDFREKLLIAYNAEEEAMGATSSTFERQGSLPDFQTVSNPAS
jgi:serine/threonine protein kinase